MSLAHRLGWPERTGYVPAAFAVTAFALGVQIALATEALGGGSYPPAGKAVLAWVSGLVLAASAVLHVPWSRGVAKLQDALGSEIPRRDVYLAPFHRPDPPPGADGGPEHAHNGHSPPSGAELRARVHSPLSAGPVVAPGEEVPLTIEAEPEELAQDLEVTITVQGPSGSGTVHEQGPGTQLEHPIVFAEPGAFTVSIELDHPRAQPAAKTIRGRVRPYREEVARLFEQLKESAVRTGLDVGPDSTPRELCRQLRSLPDVDPGSLADLAVELEVALYGDETVDRATYETVYAAASGTGLLEDPTPGVRR